MYVPAAFAEPDLAVLHRFIERYSFGLLVTQVDGQPFATHIPMLLRGGAGRFGTLVGHVARANPQGRPADDRSALAIFSGPHAYISPTWYEDRNVVPTWNYVAVHVYGRLELIEGGDELSEILQQSVREFESAEAVPWTFDDSGTFAERMKSQIVGFRLEIERIEGKFKLSQNQSPERRAKVAAALERRSDENSLAIAEMMRASLPPQE